MKESYKEKSEVYFCNERPNMKRYILHAKDSAKILEVGCGNGIFLEDIKNEMSSEVWGVELMDEYASIAEEKLDKVFKGTIESNMRLLPNNYFSAIYCNDVLEHLENPYSVLKDLKSKLADGGIIISSIPNMRYFRVLKNLMFRREWEYEKQGVMDFTHLRFFTSKSIKLMYENLDFKILEHHGINKTKSIQPFLLFPIPGFNSLDTRYLQFVTVVKNK